MLENRIGFATLMFFFTSSLSQPIALDDDVCDAGASRCASFRRNSSELRWRYAAFDGRTADIYGGDVVREAFADAGFSVVTDDSWDVLFTHFPVQSAHLDPVDRPGHRMERQRLVNHCQYFMAAGQKCTLANHIARVAHAKGHHQDRHLETYVLADPEQAEAWRKALHRDSAQHWLLKDCSGGASQGIDLVSSSDHSLIDSSMGQWRVAQAYLHDPFTSNLGQKFHVRLYVLVTNWAPVQAWLYEDGLVFRSKHAHIGDIPSADKDIFSAFSDKVDVYSLSMLWEELGMTSARKAQASISELLADVLGSSLIDSFGDPQVVLSRRSYSCFDIFGVDVMFDQQLRPYILEVNLGPNLWVERQGKQIQPTLRVVKTPLVRQIIAWAEARLRSSFQGASDALNTSAEGQILEGFHRILPQT